MAWPVSKGGRNARSKAHGGSQWDSAMITLALAIIGLCMPLYMAITLLAIYRYKRYKRFARVGEVRALIRIAHQHGYNSFQISYDLSFCAAKMQIESGLMNRPLHPLSFQKLPYHPMGLGAFADMVKVDGCYMSVAELRGKLAKGYMFQTHTVEDCIECETSDVPLLVTTHNEYTLIPPSQPNTTITTETTADQEKA